MERSVETHALGGEQATTGAILTTAGAIAHQGEQEMDKYLLVLTIFYSLPSILYCLCYSHNNTWLIVFRCVSISRSGLFTHSVHPEIFKTIRAYQIGFCVFLNGTVRSL